MDNPYFLGHTGLPIQQNMMENPEYFEKEKGIKWKIIELTTPEYEDAIKRAWRVVYGTVDFPVMRERVTSGHLEKIKGIMMQTPIDMPYLRYAVWRPWSDEPWKPSFDQEGHHRMVASELLGMKSAPVFIEYPSEVEDYDLVKGAMTGRIRRELEGVRGIL